MAEMGASAPTCGITIGVLGIPNCIAKAPVRAPRMYKAHKILFPNWALMPLPKEAMMIMSNTVIVCMGTVMEKSKM